MSKMATRIWRGRIGKRRSLPSAFSPTAQRFYQRKLAKSPNNMVLARKAVAHKLSRACYYIMRDLVPFEATKAFG